MPPSGMSKSSRPSSAPIWPPGRGRAARRRGCGGPCACACGGSASPSRDAGRRSRRGAGRRGALLRLQEDRAAVLAVDGDGDRDDEPSDVRACRRRRAGGRRPGGKDRAVEDDAVRPAGEHRGLRGGEIGVFAEQRLGHRAPRLAREEWAETRRGATRGGCGGMAWEGGFAGWGVFSFSPCGEGAGRRMRGTRRAWPIKRQARWTTGVGGPPLIRPRSGHLLPAREKAGARRRGGFLS